MSVVPESVYWWVGIAVLLFWFVGAHNRLMRLRSAGLVAYAALDAALVRQVDFVQANIASAQDGTPTEPGTAKALPAAVAQMSQMLAATRLKPLDPVAMSALGTAIHVLLMAWQCTYPDKVIVFDATGTLSRPAPLTGDADESDHSTAELATPLAWPEPSAMAEIARGQFNQAVAHYNVAIGQFPALIVAWAFRLRRAAPLV
ncbi:lema family protein [Variovorax sp. J22R133]|uniref:lema family protein n=1 Tax=Variovorax brevis TaxID=3053503 RepID=UPI002575736D|nr:lema family protein [Variovorax sp. J22R133]MDM0117071.1 lema family protein [Variovorax sp. J22R133]